MSQERKIVIGDVHGCITELDELLKLVDYKSPNTTIYSVGDLIDRGPDSVAVVSRMREIGAKAVMGNHEYHFLRWYKGGNQFYKGNTTYHQLAAHDELVTYINNMSPSIQIDPQWVIFHAGIVPNVSMKEQRKEDLYYRRFVDKNNERVSTAKILTGDIKSYRFWTDFGPFLGMNCIYGHTVHSKQKTRIRQYQDGTTCYGIDTGCVFGGRLTALILPSLQIVQVPAQKVYFESYGDVPKSID